MPQTFSNMLTHVIYSTKDRVPLITPDIKPRLYAYIGGIARELESTLLAAGGIEDHVHLLIKYPPKLAVSDLVGKIKSNSSGWAHREFGDFAWQNGFTSFSVSESVVPDVRAYLAGQEEHHRKVSFQDEVRTFLRLHGIDFDERYMWD